MYHTSFSRCRLSVFLIPLLLCAVFLGGPSFAWGESAVGVPSDSLAPSDRAASSVRDTEAFEFVYRALEVVKTSGQQDVAVGFKYAVESPVLYFHNDDTGVFASVEASEVAGDAARFTLSGLKAGMYRLSAISFTESSSGSRSIVLFSDDMAEGGSFIVTSDVADGARVLRSAPSDATEFVALDSEGTGVSGDAELARDFAQPSSSKSRMARQYVVAIDPGHGGNDPGAVGHGLRESDLTLKIARVCRDRLQENGVKVVMTRDDDTYVDLKQRADIANDAHADFFLSIHINSGGNGAAEGAEVWIPNKSTWYEAFHDVGHTVGTSILDKLSALGLANRGDKDRYYPADGNDPVYPDGSATDYLAVLRHCRKYGIPAILAEHGFIDNGADAAFLSNDSNLYSMGCADAQAIIEYLSGNPEPNAYVFGDVNASTSHVEDILWLAQKGISTGFPDRSFRPYVPIARADMAAFLYRLAGSPKFEPTDAIRGAFKDVDGGTPHHEEIWWLASTGISTGFPDGTYHPYATVARADMAAFLYRIACKPPFAPSEEGKDAFSDVDGSTPHAKEIWWLANAGISEGFPNGEYRPYGDVVRADMSAFLHRLDSIVGEGGYLTTSDKIMGESMSSKEQMVSFFKRSGNTFPADVYTDKGASTIQQFVDIAWEEASAEGVRPDVLFVQMMKETGYLSFGNQVKPEQCNFGGIGALTSGGAGHSFPDVRTGIRAQVQHLKAYASTEPLKNECVDPRFDLVTRGCAPCVSDLSGRWATGSTYGRDIVQMLDEMRLI